VSGTFNIGTGRETDVNSLFTHITAALNNTAAAEYGPAKEGEQMRSSIDASAALAAFGWKPEVRLEDGIKLTADWFAKH
jgi:UDP-glucose 4-epimerase